MLPIKPSPVTPLRPRTLGQRQKMGSSITNGWTPSQLSTKRTTKILKIPAGTLVRTDFLEEGFPRSQKKAPGQPRKRLIRAQLRQQIAGRLPCPRTHVKSPGASTLPEHHYYNTGFDPIGVGEIDQ